MTEAELLDVLRQGLWTALLAAAPILGVALVVGVAVGLAQALTSVQELTLTFVPKLAAVLIAFWITMGYSGRLLVAFYQTVVLGAVAHG